MRKLLMIAALTGMTAAAQAQEKAPKSAAERAAQSTRHMTKELGLSAEQATQVEVITLKYAQLGEARRAEREADSTAARQEGHGLRDAFAAELKTVLTEEQYAKWTMRVEERKTRRAERQRSGPPQPGQ